LPELLKDFVFFVDRSAGRYEFPDGLKKLGLNIEKHDDHFDEKTLDQEWLSFCGEKGWVVISGDLNVKRNGLERRALIASKVASFFFTSGQITAKKRLEYFTKALTRVKNYVLTQERPFIVRITPEGKIELWVNHKDEDCIEAKLKRRRQKKLRKSGSPPDIK
jgi:hypothetical protein